MCVDVGCAAFGSFGWLFGVYFLLLAISLSGVLRALADKRGRQAFLHGHKARAGLGTVGHAIGRCRMHGNLLWVCVAKRVVIIQ